MDIEELGKQLNLLAKLDPQDEFGQDKALDAIALALGNDINEMNAFLDTLNDDKFEWVAATFGDVSERLQSKAFIDMIKAQAQKHSGVDISEDISVAEAML